MAYKEHLKHQNIRCGFTITNVNDLDKILESNENNVQVVDSLRFNNFPYSIKLKC